MKMYLDVVIRFSERLWVSKGEVSDKGFFFKKKAHKSAYVIHLGSNKIYKNMKKYSWWLGMKKKLLDIFQGAPLTSK